MPMDPIHSRAAILGHPLHPVMIHFPVAALVALIGTDVAWILTGDGFWARAGLWLAGVGALVGWVSGLAGLVDLVSVGRIRRLITAWSHAVIAVLLLSLASFNWLLRVGDPQAHILPWGIYVTLLTAGLISVTGFLGGRLVYEYAVGVDVQEAVSKHTRP
jgi:uncharacterized membrane protein